MAEGIVVKVDSIGPDRVVLSVLSQLDPQRWSRFEMSVGSRLRIIPSSARKLEQMAGFIAEEGGRLERRKP